MAKLPAFQFYPGDWLKDPDLSICSIFARGLLIDLLAHMWEANRRGCLVNASGQAWSDDQIYRAIGRGEPRELVFSGLSELIDNGVLKRHESGYLFSARMVRDEAVREERRKAGSVGGKQKAKQNASKPLANGVAKPVANTIAKSGSSSSSSSSDNKTPQPPFQGGRVAKATVGRITQQELQDPDQLFAWMLREVPLPPSEDLRLKVLACSIQALRIGKQPVKFFKKLIRNRIEDGEWTVSEPFIEEASRVLSRRAAAQRKNGPEPIGEILHR